MHVHRPVEELKIPGKEDPALLTHVDFTFSSAPAVMQFFAGDEAAELGKKNWAILQVRHTSIVWWSQALQCYTVCLQQLDLACLCIKWLRQDESYSCCSWHDYATA